MEKKQHDRTNKQKRNKNKQIQYIMIFFCHQFMLEIVGSEENLCTRPKSKRLLYKMQNNNAIKMMSKPENGTTLYYITRSTVMLQ